MLLFQEPVLRSIELSLLCFSLFGCLENAGKQKELEFFFLFLFSFSHLWPHLSKTSWIKLTHCEKIILGFEILVLLSFTHVCLVENVGKIRTLMWVLISVISYIHEQLISYFLVIYVWIWMQKFQDLVEILFFLFLGKWWFFFCLVSFFSYWCKEVWGSFKEWEFGSSLQMHFFGPANSGSCVSMLG